MNEIPCVRSPYSFSNIKAYKVLCALIKEKNFDTVFCHEPVGGAIGRLAGHHCSCKVIYMAHGFHFYKGAPKSRFFYYIVEKFLSRLTDILITINQEDYEASLRFHAKKCFKLNGIGVDTSKFIQDKHYEIDKTIYPDKNALSQRWDGFGQNVAFFIHTNTDVVVLTIFSTLANVSVYAVYFMIANSLKTLVVSISSAICPSMGNVLACGTDDKKNEFFDYYEFAINIISIFSFVCGALLVTPFVMVYTKGIVDANYYQPIFGYVLIFAEAVYCFRSPYINVAYAAGHFKQTSKYAYIEAALNITISILLVHRIGLVGVAVGTAISMVYRYCLMRNHVHMILREGVEPLEKLFKRIGSLYVYYYFKYG